MNENVVESLGVIPERRALKGVSRGSFPITFSPLGAFYETFARCVERLRAPHAQRAARRASHNQSARTADRMEAAEAAARAFLAPDETGARSRRAARVASRVARRARSRVAADLARPVRFKRVAVVVAASSPRRLPSPVLTSSPKPPPRAQARRSSPGTSRIPCSPGSRSWTRTGACARGRCSRCAASAAAGRRRS